MPNQDKLTKEQREAWEDSTCSDIPESVVIGYIENTEDDDLSDLEEAYSGEYRSDVDFAQNMADEIGEIDFENQPWPQYCIDWEYAAREIMYDYFEIDGYYFRNL